MSQINNQRASMAALDLRELEHAVDDTISRTGAFLQTIVDGRRAAGLDIAAGQQALNSLADGLPGLVSFRGSLAQAHGRLARDAKRYGLDFTSAGPLETKPWDGEKETPKPRGQLQV